jgi:hypothetical protein
VKKDLDVRLEHVLTAEQLARHAVTGLTAADQFAMGFE